MQPYHDYYCNCRHKNQTSNFRTVRRISLVGKVGENLRQVADMGVVKVVLDSCEGVEVITEEIMAVKLALTKII